MSDKAQKPSEVAERLVELRQKIDKAKGKPEAADVAEFRAALDMAPDLWRALGDMQKQAERSLISLFNADASTREAVRAGLEATRRDLGYAKASPLERMLIDQVALCWLRVSIVELKHAINASQSIGIQQADHWDRALSAAQRRCLRAIETQARVRRLLRRGAVQVNIGAQQVNVSDTGTAGKEQPV